MCSSYNLNMTQMLVCIAITVSIISATLTILTILITIKLVIQQEEEHKLYFKTTSIIASICNIFCSVCVPIYAVWTIFECNHKVVFIIASALPTAFWFAGKISLIWLYNGRLYYTFKRRFQSSYYVFIFINIIFTASVPLLVFTGYYGIWNRIRAFSLCLSIARAVYFALSLYLLLMFSKKMIVLQRISYDALRQTDTSEMDSNPTDEGNDLEFSATKPILKVTRSGCNRIQQQQELKFYMKVTTKNAVLVLCSTVSACLVQLCWSLFDFAIIVPQTHVGLLLPLTMFSIDSLFNTICIYLLFNFGNDVYIKSCRKCDLCCKNICMCLSLYFWFN
eukprot:1002337_1